MPNSHSAAQQGSDPVAHPPDPEAAWHEPQHMSVRGILWSAAGLCAVALAIHLVSYWLLDAKTQQARREQPEPFPLARAIPSPPRPEPLLEGIEQLNAREKYQSLAPLYALENQRLHEYGWIDRTRRVAHVPITEAMRMLVENHLLSARSQDANRPQHKDYSSANSGRGTVK
jgi:hypothetical protein